MDQHRPDLPEDFSDVERRLTAGRPRFTQLELDRIKLRALARATRPRRAGSQTKGIALRSRVLRAAASLAAFAGVAIGAVAAFDGLASASVGQYGATSPTTGCETYSSGSTHYYVPVGDWYLNVTPNNFGGTSKNTEIALTATLYECAGNGNPQPTDPTKALTVFLSCGNNYPPGGEGTACPDGTATFSGAQVSGGDILTIPSTASSETFDVEFSGDDSVAYVMASGSGIGMAGTVYTNPFAGYASGYITS